MEPVATKPTYSKELSIPDGFAKNSKIRSVVAEVGISEAVADGLIEAVAEAEGVAETVIEVVVVVVVEVVAVSVAVAVVVAVVETVGELVGDGVAIVDEDVEGEIVGTVEELKVGEGVVELIPVFEGLRDTEDDTLTDGVIDILLCEELTEAVTEIVLVGVIVFVLKLLGVFDAKLEAVLEMLDEATFSLVKWRVVAL